MPRRRPDVRALAGARDAVLADVVGPSLRVLFCGINPGLYSAAIGHNFGRPGNRFWPVLHRSGFTPHRFDPSEERELLALGLGITNIATRATAAADELTADELRAGAVRLERKVARLAPRWIAFLGLGAYRTAFERPRAALGPQAERLADARIWLLPSPSGLNAHYGLEALTEQFAALRKAVERSSRS
jgi:TDG/mug DNA glycosylase family protein